VQIEGPFLAYSDRSGLLVTYVSQRQLDCCPPMIRDAFSCSPLIGYWRHYGQSQCSEVLSDAEGPYQSRYCQAV
jgi:hypothetical protein